jgi:regulator of sirC expression with transglutaminase-like and TPR domain
VNIDLFRTELNREPIDPVRAAFAFAQAVAYPALDVASQLARLDSLAAEARPAVQHHESAAVRADMLAAFLFEEKGFKGNRAGYDDPLNSFLNRVLDRQLGIPISLSLIYMALAQRLDIPAFGVALPGHFVVGVVTGDEPFYLDPFHGGVRLSREDCRERVVATTGFRGVLQPEWFDPVSPRAMIQRMLNNLRISYQQRSDWLMASRTLELLDVMQPNMPDIMRDMGLVYLQLGRYYRAATLLEKWVQTAADSAETAQIKDVSRRALAPWSRLN